MKIQIRKATVNDCGRILELIKELAQYERAPQEVTITLQHLKDSGFGSQPVWWAFVADVFDEDGKSFIAGFALYYIRFSTWKGQAIYLEDILVTEAMRGHKIGTLLFERIMQEAKEKDMHRICWQVLNWNEPAINFYKKYNCSFDGEWVNCAITL